MESIVEVRNLKKSFGDNVVLKDINFTLNKGENTVVLGRSGSGKSILIKCLVALLFPTEGEVLLFKKNVSTLNDEELNSIRKKVGFLFQSAALYDSMTVRENLAFPMRELKDTSKQEINQLVEEALSNVGLLEAIEKMPSELSGGMKKRVGLARAIILKPELILYDEPTTGLDPITSREISHLILEIQKKYNTSSLIITHDVACAKITANHILVLKDGVFVAQGTYAELAVSQDEWVRSFFE